MQFERRLAWEQQAQQTVVDLVLVVAWCKSRVEERPNKKCLVSILVSKIFMLGPAVFTFIS